jgi:hypothetical protein
MGMDKNCNTEAAFDYMYLGNSRRCFLACLLSSPAMKVDLAGYSWRFAWARLLVGIDMMKRH